MKKREYISKRKNNKSINLLIILIGVAAIMLTGFAYASKLKSIDDYSYSKIQEDNNTKTAKLSNFIDLLMES